MNEDGASDARAEGGSASDSDEDARVLRSDVHSTGIWNERRFRDARLARAPVSLVESVVPADDDDATRLETKPKKTKSFVFVTVCDANAHGLREGDGVAFIDPLAEDTDDVARKDAARDARPTDRTSSVLALGGEGVFGRSRVPTALAVSIDEAESLGGGHDAARSRGVRAPASASGRARATVACERAVWKRFRERRYQQTQAAARGDRTKPSSATRPPTRQRRPAETRAFLETSSRRRTSGVCRRSCTGSQRRDGRARRRGGARRDGVSEMGRENKNYALPGVYAYTPTAPIPPSRSTRCDAARESPSLPAWASPPSPRTRRSRLWPERESFSGARRPRRAPGSRTTFWSSTRRFRSTWIFH